MLVHQILVKILFDNGCNISLLSKICINISTVESLPIVLVDSLLGMEVGRYMIMLGRVSHVFNKE